MSGKVIPRRGASYFTLYWQVKKTLKSLHFNLLFFLLSQLVWPLILVGTYYLSYTPLLKPGAPEVAAFAGGADLFTYLIPGIIVIFLYMEYVSTGFGLSIDRDYGVLEPIFLSPVNRLLWLFGNTISIFPSGILASAGFVLSSHIIFSIHIPHPALLSVLILFVILTSLPWGAMVCSIFLSGRNMRFLYAVFETPGEFLSGSRFPLTALPGLLSGLAVLYPLSHAVNILRYCWFETIPWQKVFVEGSWLIGLGLIYALLSMIIFSAAEEKGKSRGNLTFT
ncbi:MAG: ABC transporter permease [Spirochaetales bacterium]|nr:ABC transporter permease [Spirochaetales bacterium]